MRASSALGRDENGPRGEEMNECRAVDKEAEEAVTIGKEINENPLSLCWEGGRDALTTRRHPPEQIHLKAESLS